MGVYAEGHRVVISFSGGKDSGVCVELAIMARQALGQTEPVEVVMRDEEVMLPGTFEYAERVAARPEVSFHWIVQRQPVINVFNRVEPYFWCFDDRLSPDQWMRVPPPFAKWQDAKTIFALTTVEEFPPPEGKSLFVVTGLRGQESGVRLAGIHSSGGARTGHEGDPRRYLRPIYDWTDGDIWKAIRDMRWDYNRAYDTLFRFGVPRHRLRIGPPTMSFMAVHEMDIARRAWPRWFDRLAERLPGVRTAAMFGKRYVTPERRMGETWEQCFQRECIDRAPAPWIAERATKVADYYRRQHARHSTAPFPDVTRCSECGSSASWRSLARIMYNGNPFSLKMDNIIPYMEPEFFRPGSGTWGASPTAGT